MSEEIAYGLLDYFQDSPIKLWKVSCSGENVLVVEIIKDPSHIYLDQEKYEHIINAQIRILSPESKITTKVVLKKDVEIGHGDLTSQ